MGAKHRLTKTDTHYVWVGWLLLYSASRCAILQLINSLHGMVADFGVYIARGLARVIGFAEDILMDEVLNLPKIANEVIHNLCEHLMALHTRIR